VWREWCHIGVPVLRPAEKGNHFIFRDEILASFLIHSSLFLILMFLLKILSSFVKGAVFVNRKYGTNLTLRYLQRIFNHSVKINLWSVTDLF